MLELFRSVTLTKTITTKRNSKEDRQQCQRLQLAKDIKRQPRTNDNQGHQKPTVLHTPQISLSSPHRKPPLTNAGRLIQPNNLLKVLTANVQSLSPKNEELIALIQVENFDAIAKTSMQINETWLDTQTMHLFAEVAKHGYKVFHVEKPTPKGWGGGSIMCVKNTMNPIERKSSATCTREIIQVHINPENAVHLKLALTHRNKRITADDDDEFYTMLEKIYHRRRTNCEPENNV